MVLYLARMCSSWWSQRTPWPLVLSVPSPVTRVGVAAFRRLASSVASPLQTAVLRASPVQWVRQKAAIGDSTKVQGWVRSVRKQKGVTFLEVNDGSSQKSLQVVVDDKTTVGEGGSEGLSALLTTGCSVYVDGQVVKSPHSAQRVEVVASTIRIIGTCDAADYPLQKKVGTLVVAMSTRQR